MAVSKETLYKRIRSLNPSNNELWFIWVELQADRINRMSIEELKEDVIKERSEKEPKKRKIK